VKNEPKVETTNAAVHPCAEPFRTLKKVSNIITSKFVFTGDNYIFAV